MYFVVVTATQKTWFVFVAAFLAIVLGPLPAAIYVQYACQPALGVEKIGPLHLKLAPMFFMWDSATGDAYLIPKFGSGQLRFKVDSATISIAHGTMKTEMPNKSGGFVWSFWGMGQ